MNRVWRTLVVFLLLFGIATLAHASDVFQKGDSGQEVVQIQSQLINLGYKLSAADGVFGSQTANAVKAFQQDRGLEPDGVVGSATYMALMGREIPANRGGSVSVARRIVQSAVKQVGTPYRFGGNGPGGFDCSGFVRYIFGGAGIYLPRMADEQYSVGQPVVKSRLLPGDTVYFSTYTSGISHVGIYVGDGKFVSATSSRGVAIDRLDDGYWGPRYLGAARMF